MVGVEEDGDGERSGSRVTVVSWWPVWKEARWRSRWPERDLGSFSGWRVRTLAGGGGLLFWNLGEIKMMGEKDSESKPGGGGGGGCVHMEMRTFKWEKGGIELAWTKDKVQSKC